MYAFITSINCNWDRDVKEAIYWDRDGVSAMKDLWDHCSRLDDWSFGRPLSTRFPELRDVVRLTEYPDEEGG